MGVISILTNRPKIVLIIGYIYITFSTKLIFLLGIKIQWLKNFIIVDYIIFKNHNFNANTFELFTIKESLFRLFTFLLLFFFIGLYINKKLDICKGV